MVVNTVFKPTKEMTFVTAPLDCERLRDYCLTNCHTTLNIDLSEVTTCDSAGLSLLIQAQRFALENNKVCVIFGMTEMIAAMVEFCGLETLLRDCFTVP